MTYEDYVAALAGAGVALAWSDEATGAGMRRVFLVAGSGADGAWTTTYPVTVMERGPDEGPVHREDAAVLDGILREFALPIPVGSVPAPDPLAALDVEMREMVVAARAAG